MRRFIQGILGFFIGRVFVYSMNPFAVAYFIVSYIEGKSSKLMVAALLAGMVTAVPGIDLLRYALTFLVVIVLDGFCRKHNLLTGVSHERCVLVGAAGMNLILGITKGVLSFQMRENIILALLESIAIVTLVVVFRFGMRFLLYKNLTSSPTNEELISIVLLICIGIFGIPQIMESYFSIGETIGYVFILFMGYRYGAATGAICGAGVGITALAQDKDLVMIGLYCLLGISVGLFRALGKVATGLLYLGISIILMYEMRDKIVDYVEIRAAISGVIVFFFVPREKWKPLELMDAKYEEQLVSTNLKEITEYKMEDFAGVFRRLSKAFSSMCGTQRELTEGEWGAMLDDMTGYFCKECPYCQNCWEDNYENTYNGLRQLLYLADNQEVENVMNETCLHARDYIELANQNIRFARTNIGWENRLVESRRFLAGQMEEIADVIAEFTKEMKETNQEECLAREDLKMSMQREGVTVRSLSVIKGRDGHLQVHMQARAKGRQLVTSRDICRVLENEIGKRFRPKQGTKSVIPKANENFIFYEDVKYKVLTGHARIAKAGELRSGDNFSFMELENGEMLMILCDGMGSGENANAESGELVDLLEGLFEAGFSQKLALRLIQSVFAQGDEKCGFSTLDMASINLYNGQCEFFKSGAAASFIRHKKDVQTVYIDTLPLGIVPEDDLPCVKDKLCDGEFIVMMTDGVVDSFPGREKEFYIQNILDDLHSNNPQEIATNILEQALQRCEGTAFDDMSVMVAGIWEK